MNKKSLRKVFAGVAAVVFVSTGAFAVDTITWGTLPANRAYNSDGTTLITADQFVNTIGGFMQLIYLGANGVYDGFVNSGTGVVNDDVVAQTSWFGVGAMGRPGEATTIFSASSAVNSMYEIRFFSNPSANYAGGALPAGGTYGLSQVFTQSGNPALGGTDSFLFNQNYSATIPVPEPSTVALMLAGLGVLGFARMRRK